MGKHIKNFDDKYFVNGDTGCWIWRNVPHHSGYGHASINGKVRLAHRVSFERAKGPIPDNLTLDHLCRNRRCVNPDHLEAVTMKVNLLRGTGAPAHNAVKTHCPNGHPLSGANLRIDGHSRRCRICRNARNLRYYYKKTRVQPSD